MSAVVQFTPSAASVPALYENAKTALEQCASIDEVKNWSDQAAAIRAYAVMRDDESLLIAARKIQLRAIRRMGELLEEVKPSKGGRPPETRAGDDPSFATRKQVASDAGLSSRQTKEALRIAKVPVETVEEMVEMGHSVSDIANVGKRPLPAPTSVTLPPRISDEALWVYGRLKDMEREGYFALDPATLFDGMKPIMQQDTLRLMPKLAEWAANFTRYLNERV